MLGLLRLALGPVLLWQGARVRRNILRMPEPGGPREGLVGDGPSLRLLILGDSSAAGVGCAHQDQALGGRLPVLLGRRRSVRWRVFATTGWTTAEAFAAMPGLGEETFDIAVISLGVNDITTEVPVPAWLETYRCILERLRTVHGVSRFVICGLPPMGAFPALPQPLRWYLGLQKAKYERALASWCAPQREITFLPLDFASDVSEMAEDGFHPGPVAYGRWAEHLVRAISPGH